MTRTTRNNGGNSFWNSYSTPWKRAAAVAAVTLSGLSAALAPAQSASSGSPDHSLPSLSAPAAVGLKATMAVAPNPPVVGANTLTVMVTDPANHKSVAGLNLSATVAMTTMDMGTTHPRAKDLGNGVYQTMVNFTMQGPWRVNLEGRGSDGAALNASAVFDAGSKKVWRQPEATAVEEPSGSMQMHGMQMNQAGAVGPRGVGDQHSGYLDTKSHPMHAVPRLQQIGEYTASGNEDWEVRTGFGKNAGMVKMMMLMMVGGSGSEGMKMPPMNMSFGPQNWSDEGGSSPDSTAGMSGMNMPGMNMPGMNMPGMNTPGMNTPGMSMPEVNKPGAGTTTPAPSASIQHPPATAPASSEAPMVGMPEMKENASPTTSSQSVKSTDGSSTPNSLKITAAILPDPPGVGKNTLTVTAIDPRTGKPVLRARVLVSVAMATMDMGTTHPAARETSPGHYTAPVQFSMAGPWRVTVTVTPAGGKPQPHSFTFKVKG